MATAENLPLFWEGSTSQRSSLMMSTDDVRLSFPATVRDSVSSNLTITPRSTPPPVPDKPPSLYSFKDKDSSSRAPSPATTRPTSSHAVDSVSRSSDEQRQSVSPSERPTTWLNMMLTRSESGETMGDAAKGADDTQTRGTAPPIPARPISASATAQAAPHLPPRPLSSSSSGAGTSAPQPVSTSASATTTHALSTSPSASNALHAITSRLQQTNQQFKIRDRLVGAVGAGRDWGGKMLQDGLKQFGSTAATSTHRSGTGSVDMSSSLPPAPAPPTSVFGHKLPRVTRSMAYGLTLPAVVSTTRPGVAPFSRRSSTFRKVNDIIEADEGLDSDPVTGTASKRWLPAVAYRSLQYLDVHGATEVGLYRVGGGSQLVAQIRALFDSGIDLDLRTISPQDGLDPHAVATAFKAWLRELPESSVLSPRLQARIDALTSEALGHPASGSQMINAVATAGTTATTSTTGTSATASLTAADRPVPSASYIEALQKIFAQDMEAEYFHLLRALCYHLARVADHSETNKMTLSNLRLILSPTLRLSPIFLQVLVDERDTIFAGPNESAGRREYDSPARRSLEPPKAASATSRNNSRPPSPNVPYTSAVGPESTNMEPPTSSQMSPSIVEVLVPDVSSEDGPSARAASPASSLLVTGNGSATPIADKFGGSSNTSTYQLNGSSASSLVGSGSSSSSSNTSPVFSSVSHFGTLATTASSSGVSEPEQLRPTTASSSENADNSSGQPRSGLQAKPAFLPSRGNSLESDHAGRRSWFANRGDLPAPRSPHSGSSLSGGASPSSSSSTKLSPVTAATSNGMPALGPAKTHRPMMGKGSRRSGSASSFSSLLSIGSSSGNASDATGGSAATSARKALRRATSSSLLSGIFNGSTVPNGGNEQEQLKIQDDDGSARATATARSPSAGRRAARRLSGFFGASQFPSPAAQTSHAEKLELDLPPTIGAVGLGLGMNDRDVPDGSLLLSVEERRKYFEQKSQG